MCAPSSDACFFLSSIFLRCKQDIEISLKMSNHERIIPLDDEIRKLYIQYDYAFFTEENLRSNEYPSKDIQVMKASYKETKQLLLRKIKSNKRQGLFFLDGDIRKMHSGGLLPARFNLDETRSWTILDFEAEGECWACFDVWKKFEKRRYRRKNLSELIVKIGSILGIALSVLKIFELLVSSH